MGPSSDDRKSMKNPVNGSRLEWGIIKQLLVVDIINRILTKY